MKHWTLPNRTGSSSCSAQTQSAKRQGTTLVIVIALLGLLTLMGFVFYSFASQELSNATNYVASAKNDVTTPDDGMPFFMRQLLIGPTNVEQNSVLSSGYHSMIPNLVGNDSRPGTGSGRPIATALTAAGPVPALPPGQIPNSGLNFSRGSRAGNRVVNLPQPDAGYTYTDHNNMFLGQVGVAVRRLGGVNSYVPVIVPSFMRPGMFRPTAVTGAGHATTANIAATDTSAGTAWYSSAGYQHITFRPSPGQIFIGPNGRPVDDPTIGGTQNVLRFLNAGNTEDAAEISALPGGSGGFPFTPVPPTGYTGADPAVDGEMGIWTNPAATGTALNAYELDVDNDGDGTPDSIWLDLDYPVLEDPETGAKYTMLFSTLVIDLDGLINLNATGNLNGFVNFRSGSAPFGGFVPTTTVPKGVVPPQMPPTRPGTSSWEGTVGGRTDFISQSNLSLSPYEINPLWTMLRPSPTTPFDFSQHQAHFGAQFTFPSASAPTTRPFDASEAANMELFWMLKGRGVYTDAPASTELEDMFVGKWGESDRLYKALQTIVTSTALTDMPLPGTAYEDDNGDLFEGTATQGRRGFAHPTDFSGAGSFVRTDDPRRLFEKQATGTPVVSQQYFRYSIFDGTVTQPYVWNGSFGTSDFERYLLGPNGTWDNGAAGNDDLIQFPLANRTFDDPTEFIADPERTLKTVDESLGAKDIATLFLQNEDLDAVGATKRLLNLMPFTLNADGGATTDEDMRKRFTTLSWQLRNFTLADPRGVDGVLGTGDDLARAFEFNADSSLHDSNDDGINDPNGRFEFPPRFGATVTHTEGSTTVTTEYVKPFERRIDANNNINEDPFRPQARRMLRLELNDPNSEFGQLPLSINHLVDVERLPNRAANLLRGTLELRSLTEHPDASETNSDGDPIVLQTSALAVSSLTQLPKFPPSTVGEREFWARRDRQKLARDIYVLLYTMGGNNNGTLNAGADQNNNYTNGINNINAEIPSYTMAGSGGAPAYTVEQLRQMAQFAVNLVDALDRDNVITKFEYDLNLGTTTIVDNTTSSDSDETTLPQDLVGWNLDDNPDTANDINVSPTITEATDFNINDYERGVVYGVEAQQLTLGEAIAVLSRATSDNDATPYNDDDGDRMHVYYELQNMLPYSVPLATSVSTNAATGIWRVRTEIDAPVATAGDPANESLKTMTFIASGTTGSGSFDSVSAGSQYTVAARDTQTETAGTASSDYYIDDTVSNTNFKRLIPPDATPVVVTDRSIPGRTTDHVDLVYHDGSSPARTRVDLNGAGTLFEDLDFSNFTTTPTIKYILERRANPNMPSLSLAENPWVEVDRTRQTFDRVNYDSVTDNATLVAALNNTLSTVRTEALDRTSEKAHPAGTSIYEHTSIGSHSGTAFTLRQHHFDRDFASVVDLFDLPLFGPQSLTTLYAETMNQPTAQASSSTANTYNSGAALIQWTGTGTELPVAPPMRDRVPNEGLVASASAKFLMADFPDGSTSAADGTAAELPYDNRWYRILPLLEVPTRMHRQLGNPIQLTRTPGKINLNTVRHAATLAALIDDSQVADLALTTGVANPLWDQLHVYANAGQTPAPPNLAADRSTAGTNAGDWFNQLLESRDGAFTSTPMIGGVPVSSTLFLPGMHDNPATAAVDEGSNPFRTATAEVNNPDLQHTLMRSLPAATGTADRRHLLEASTAGDHTANDYNYHDPSDSTDKTAPSTPRVRNRILAKVMNNSATQSNAFAVYVTIGFFEVYEDPSTGAVRIGGQYDFDQDTATPIEDNHKKSLFVVDRSEVFEAYDAGSGQFDWRRLIKHRTDIQE